MSSLDTFDLCLLCKRQSAMTAMSEGINGGCVSIIISISGCSLQIQGRTEDMTRLGDGEREVDGGTVF